MQRIPIRIKLADLPRSARGYSVKATEQLLEEIAKRYEALVVENDALADRLQQLDADVARYRQQDQLVSNALLAAKHASESLRDDARREAELILKKARKKAAEIVRGSEVEHRKLVAETERLDALAQTTRESLVAVLLETLERIEGRAGAGGEEGTSALAGSLLRDLREKQ